MPDKLDTVVFYVWSCGQDLIWNFASAGRTTLCCLQFNGQIVSFSLSFQAAQFDPSTGNSTCIKSSSWFDPHTDYLQRVHSAFQFQKVNFLQCLERASF